MTTALNATAAMTGRAHHGSMRRGSPEHVRLGCFFGIGDGPGGLQPGTVYLGRAHLTVTQVDLTLTSDPLE